MIYLPARSLAAAQAMSAAMWKLFVPAGDTGATQAFVPWKVHPTSNAVVLCFPDVDDPRGVMPILNTSAFSNVATLLQPFVTAGQISSQDIANLQNAVLTAHGANARLTIWSNLPPYFQGIAMNQLQANAAGFFPDPIP